MKSSFPGHYSPTSDDLKALWTTGVVAIDANVLLILYKYSTPTQEQFIELFKRIVDRLWLPYNAALEYHQNRLKVISDQVKSYDALVVAYERILKDIDASRGHPYVSTKLRSQLGSTFDTLKTESDTNRSTVSSLLRDDTILTSITDLFLGRVGPPLTERELDAVLNEGVERYKRGIPPGFEDAKKPDHRRYGDLIIWKQLLAKANAEKKPVIFVTDDSKEDWWWMHDGNTIGCLPALRAEMMNASGKPFHLYRPDRFLATASSQLKQKIEKDAIKEVKETQKRVVDLRATFDRSNLANAFAEQIGKESRNMVAFSELISRQEKQLKELYQRNPMEALFAEQQRLKELFEGDLTARLLTEKQRYPELLLRRTISKPADEPEKSMPALTESTTPLPDTHNSEDIARAETQSADPPK